MASAQKPLVFNDTTGGFDEINPKSVSAGAADAGKLFVPGSNGQWDESLLPAMDGARAVMASETLSPGDFVNVFNDDGTPKLRRADASSIATRAHGFVKTGAIEGETAKVYESGPATGLSGLAIGATCFLSAAAPGEITTTAPTVSGHIAQVVGVAVSATEIQVDVSEQPVVRA